MLMKKDEGGENRPSREELEGMSFDDLSSALADGTITRAKAIKLAGAALLGGALTVLWADEADARNRRRRRRKKRRRRRKAQVTQPTPIVPVVGGLIPVILNVTNPSDDRPLTIGGVRVVDGEGLAGANLLNGESVTIAPVETLPVTINLDITDPLIDAGSLKLIDGRGMPITVVDEEGVVVGNGDVDLVFGADVA